MNTRKTGSTTRRSSTSRAKKPATIDLEAKKSPASGAEAKSSPANPQSKTAKPTEKAAATSTAAKASDAGKQTPPLGRSGAKPAEKPATPPKKETPSSEKKPAKDAGGNKTGFVPMLGAGLVGGVCVAALLAGLQFGGVLNFPNGSTSSNTPVGVSAEQFEALAARIDALPTDTNGERIDALEGAVTELKSAPAETDQGIADQITALESEIAGLKSVLDGLATTENGEVPDAAQLTAALAQAGQRIDKVETTLSDLLASGNEGNAATEQQLGELSGRLEEVAKASDDKITPLADEVQSVRSAVDTLSASVEKNTAGFEKLQSESSQLQQSIASVKASEKVARSVAVNALGSALKNDDSLVLAIASLESLGGKSAETERLAELASSGIPTVVDLLSGLEELTSTVQNPVQTDAGGTLSEKFWANARNLVTFRSSGPQEGNSSIAVLSRVKSGIELGQLENALTEWKQLPMDVQGAGKDWAAQLEKRIEAFSLYQKLADNLQNEAS